MSNINLLKDKEQETQYIIKGPRSILYFGVGFVMIGFAAAGLCLYSKIQGNLTASIGIMLLFIILFSVPGMYLIWYGNRSVTIQAEQVAIKSLFFGCNTIPLQDIKSVKWRIDGYTFYGANRKLFKIYDITPECEMFLWKLIRNGVEVVPPNGTYSIPQKKDYDPQFFSFSIHVPTHFGSMRILSVSDKKLRLKSFLRKGNSCSLSEIREVKLDIASRTGRLALSIITWDGNVFCRITRNVKSMVCDIRVVKLVRYFRKCGVNITGYDKLDDRICYLFLEGIIEPEEIIPLLSQEYQRLKSVCETCNVKLYSYGIKMVYRIVELSEGNTNLTISGNGGKYVTFHSDDDSFRVRNIYLISFVQNGRILNAKRDELMLYEKEIIKSTEIKTPEGQETIYLFEPGFSALLKYLSEYCCTQVVKKQFSVSDQYLAEDLKVVGEDLAAL